MRKVVVAALVLIAAALVALVAVRHWRSAPMAGPVVVGDVADGFVPFASAEEFQEYMARSSGASASGMGMAMAMPMAKMANMAMDTATTGMPAPQATSINARAEYAPGGMGDGARVSTTNVQVAGIDEPDILKNDGKRLYVSREGYWGSWDSVPRPMMMGNLGTSEGISSVMPADMTDDKINEVTAVFPAESDAVEPVGGADTDAKMAPGIMPPQPVAPGTTVIDAVPAATMAAIGKVAENGQLLLAGKTLVILTADGRHVVGYDVTDAAAPARTWEVVLEDNTNIVTARQKGDTIYLLQQTMMGSAVPCPFVPMTVGAAKVTVPCTEIYHPVVPSASDAVMTLAALDARTGTVASRVSFVASAYQSTVYVDATHAYVASPRTVDVLPFLVGFLEANPSLTSPATLAHLRAVMRYDLSPEAKMTEFQTTIDKDRRGRTSDDQLTWETAATNAMKDYATAHLRELSATGIVKVALDGTRVVAHGAVPGRLLNQFAMDAYEGHLRVATTVGGDWGMIGGQMPSANDVVVLDGDLHEVGAVRDMGKGEQIYAARFLGDRGYVVTFRQTDPFYVLDLSRPTSPRMTGELKIPGYSSYLHPLGDHLVLGVGRDESQVKLSLFDVSDAAAPREVSVYMLDEYWSEALDNHHAFLADTAAKRFFLPGGKGGYVMSYAGDKLTLVRALAGSGVSRAAYIGDTLYVLSDTALRAYDQRTWDKVGEVTLPSYGYGGGVMPLAY